MVDVKIKKLNPEAVIPHYATEGSAGLDLTAVSVNSHIGPTGAFVEYKTGLSLEIPEGFVGLLYPRSSIFPKTSLALANSVGVIDSDYRGEVVLRFRDYNNFMGHKMYNVGDRVGQLIIVPYPRVNFVEAEELDDTERGEGGFGSSGD